jgi:hypothetical protein
MSPREAETQARLLHGKGIVLGMKLEDVVRRWPTAVKGIDMVIEVHDGIVAMTQAAETLRNALAAQAPDDFDLAVERAAAARVTGLQATLDQMTDRYLEAITAKAA